MKEEDVMVEVELNSLILALKAKIWLYKSETRKIKDVGGQVEIK